jgi:hypothetical protein
MIRLVVVKSTSKVLDYHEQASLHLAYNDAAQETVSD